MYPVASAISLRGFVAPWVFMWMIAVAIFAGFKWWTWHRAVTRGIETTWFRSVAFLFFWPGMDAEKFLAPDRTVPPPPARAWIFAAGKTLFGATLMWGLARFAGQGLAAGWIGMVGFIFLLHFGLFHLLALFWQRQGIDAVPIMRWPLLARSAGDFWGRRWNAGFRDLAFGLLFTRLAGVLPPRAAMLAIFLVSGLLHELVITLPAHGAYGLPTFYFALQGLGLLAERSLPSLRRGIMGRIFAIVLVAAPITALFPAVFVLRVMVPFFQFIGALS